MRQLFGFAIGQQFLHLLAFNGLLQDDFAAFKCATGFGLLDRGYGFFAQIVAGTLKHAAAAGGAVAQTFLRAEVLQLARVIVFGAKVEFELVIFDFLVAHQLQLGHKRPARFRAEALQRAYALIRQQGIGLLWCQGAPAWGFRHRKSAGFFARSANTGKAAVVFLHLAAAIGAGVA